MDVLILGGTGLISSAITRALLTRGDRVTLFNRGRTPVRFDASGVRRLAGDRKDRAAFETTVGNAGPFDAVIDMICMVPEDAESTVRACRGVARQVVLCSTVDVYGMPASRFPIVEDEPRCPVADNGKGKVPCEDLVLEAGRRGDFTATIIRAAYTYGEGREPTHTFGRRGSPLWRLRGGLPVILPGDGTALRAACHADDLAGAFVGALGNPRADGRAYHAGGEEWLTWNRYTELLAEGLGGPSPRVVHIPTQVLARVAPRWATNVVQNYQYHKILDNTAARADLGFRYTIPFAEGVRRTVAWLDAHGGPSVDPRPAFYDHLIDAWERHTEALAQSLAGQDE